MDYSTANYDYKFESWSAKRPVFRAHAREEDYEGRIVVAMLCVYFVVPFLFWAFS